MKSKEDASPKQAGLGLNSPQPPPAEWSWARNRSSLGPHFALCAVTTMVLCSQGFDKKMMGLDIFNGPCNLVRYSQVTIAFSGPGGNPASILLSHHCKRDKAACNSAT